MFGGHGSAAMLEIAKRVDESSVDVQLIFLCGHNVELSGKIRSLQLTKPALIEDFTTRVEYFMSLADVFIGRAGPGSISEALQFGLPLIVEDKSRTMPQERYNPQWLTEKRLGIAVRDFGEIATAIEQLLEKSLFAEFRENVSNCNNYAIFEVPLILDQIATRKATDSIQIAPTLTSVDPFGRVAWAGLT